MKIEKTDIIHSLYNATTVGWDEVNNKWLALDASGNAINVVSDDVDAEYEKQQYKNQRVVGSATTSGYGEISNQLDQLYHDIASGKFGADAKTGNWYVGIASVKSGFPKPS